jgi:hypothetical protein
MTPPDPSSPPHLAPGAAALLDLSDDMRIRAIRTKPGWGSPGPGVCSKSYKRSASLRHRRGLWASPSLPIAAWRHDAHLRMSLKWKGLLTRISC